MRTITMLVVATGITATPAWAGDAPQAPLSQREITAIDVAATPISDLNLRKSKIPAQLIAAQDKPYDLVGLDRCAHIAAEVGELDALLGEDLDVAQAQRRRPSAGHLAQWAVGTFIPFRGAIRELSGANAQQRQVAAAIQAGLNRRAFLKGVGEAKGCLYPARSATADVLAARDAERKMLADAKQSNRRKQPASQRSPARLTLAAEDSRQP